MPEKSVREMTLLERQHYSLASRTFRATIAGSLVLGLVALLVGLGLYAYALGGQYVGAAFDLSRTASVVLPYAADAEALSGEVMARYRALSDEERAQAGTEAYRAHFAGIEADGTYRAAVETLKLLLGSGDMEALYLGRFDAESGAFVYFADAAADPAAARGPGDWVPAESRTIRKFLGWDGVGRLYRIERTGTGGWRAVSGVPVRNGAGETVAFVLADVRLTAVAKGMRSFTLQYAVAMFLAVNAVGILMARRMSRTLVRPINEIAGAAERYVRDRKEGAGGTEHFAGLKISTGDEVENLALVMADMERELSAFEDDLTRVTAEKERVGTELALAKRIQADMMPNIFPAFPDRPDFDVFASMTPAKEVGGDFYDFFLVDEDHLALVMADVSGKGVPAALFMMVSKILVQNETMSGLSPREVLERMNEQICANNREEMFVTVWLGILDLSTGRLTAANAGHEYPVLKRPGGDFEILRDKHGFVVGGMAGMKYREYELTLEPGAKLFLYTDGLTEAADASNAPFGKDRMLEALCRAESGTPREILETVSGAAELFVGDAPQFDDLTMLCVHYIGKDADRAGRELTVEASVQNIARVTEFVNGALDRAGCPDRARRQIDVAVDELFSNIARYAYTPGTGFVTVRVAIGREPAAAEITFTDGGAPYDPYALEEPDTTLPAEEREIGGLGVFLVKKLMDEAVYERREGRNVHRIRKSFGPAGAAPRA